MTQKWFERGDSARYLIDNERCLFHNEMKSTVWVTQSQETNGEYVSVGTGFCIHPSGLILTCNHNIVSADIKVISLGEQDGNFAATVLRKIESWDLAILKVEKNDEQPFNFDYIKFAEKEDQVFCGEEVHSIGNPDDLSRSFMSGRVVYPVEDIKLNYLDRIPIGLGLAKTLANSHWTAHRTPRDLMLQRGGGVEANANLDRNLPFFQISNYLAIEGGSGSPIFDNRGCVIGMLIQLAGHYNFAIHFSVLKRFVSDHSLNDGTSKGSSSKSRTQKKKNPEPPQSKNKKIKRRK